MNQHLVKNRFPGLSNLKGNKKDQYHLLNVLNSCFGEVHFKRHLFPNKLKSIAGRPSGVQLHPGRELQVGKVLLMMPASVLRFQLESKYFPSNSIDSLFGEL